jgi:nucleolar protein 56
MKIYLVEHAIGTFAFDERGELVDYAHNPREVSKVIDYLLENEEGEPLPSALELVKKLKPEEVIVEDEREVPRLQGLTGVKTASIAQHPGAKAFRASMASIALSTNFISSEQELYDYLHQLSLELTRRKLRKAAQRRDLLAIQAVRAMDDIDKTINLFSERLREWYSVHFPELDKMLEDHRQYASIVSRFGYRDAITSKEDLVDLGLQEQRATRIVDVAKRSIGAELSEADIRALTSLSNTMLRLFEIRDELNEYVDSVMREVAPNVTALVDSSLGARLLSLANGLDELAKMPASTIQVLGAEKALFRALRSGARPPKHGIIYQYPAIHGSPRWQRGKIARALASKLAIAAKIDAFSGRLAADQLADQLNKRIEEIKSKYPSPPPRQETPPRQERESRGRKRERGRNRKRRGRR